MPTRLAALVASLSIAGTLLGAGTVAGVMSYQVQDHEERLSTAEDDIRELDRKDSARDEFQRQVLSSLDYLRRRADAD